MFVALLLPQAVGLVGGLVTAPAVRQWYQFLHKPAFNPPDGVFAPVWFVLYILMGWASFLVWTRAARPFLFRLYLVHLAVNLLWSVLFFGLHSPGLAFLDIVVLWGMVTAMLILFRSVSRLAALLLVPYWCWVSFAAALNLAVWRLN
ncbi:MAG: tryptophan-rich sensory protein [Candidatus Omnitrophica bacterium]|nr:tryptophan-rich sensory protein [Candidatus Omnitrophota bacterium]